MSQYNLRELGALTVECCREYLVNPEREFQVVVFDGTRKRVCMYEEVNPGDAVSYIHSVCSHHECERRVAAAQSALSSPFLEAIQMFSDANTATRDDMLRVMGTNTPFFRSYFETLQRVYSVCENVATVAADALFALELFNIDTETRRYLEINSETRMVRMHYNNGTSIAAYWFETWRVSTPVYTVLETPPVTGVDTGTLTRLFETIGLIAGGKKTISSTLIPS